jgi:hypothetical protein
VTAQSVSNMASTVSGTKLISKDMDLYGNQVLDFARTWHMTHHNPNIYNKEDKNLKFLKQKKICFSELIQILSE